MEIAEFLEDDFSSYLLFRKDRFRGKAKKLADSTKRVNISSSTPKEDKTKNKITFQAVKILIKSLGKSPKEH